MADYLPVPETFNGTPTRYRLFDGFRTVGGWGKALYVAGFLFSPAMLFIPLVPLAMEGLAYNRASNNRSVMEAFIRQQTAMTRTPGLSLAQMPDLNPNVYPNFRADERARRRAAEREMTQGRPSP